MFFSPKISLWVIWTMFEFSMSYDDLYCATIIDKFESVSVDELRTKRQNSNNIWKNMNEDLTYRFTLLVS